MTTNAGRMLIKSYEHPWISHRSFLLLDPRSGTAVAVDPYRDVDPYLEDAYAAGCRIRHVFLTQLHSDFEPGHLELRDRAGAEIYLGAWARVNFACSHLKTGDVLEFGTLRLQIAETPGHRLEGLSLLAYDLERSDRAPVALLSGDTLIEGEVGAPVQEPVRRLSCGELCTLLHHSLRQHFRPLPDETRLYPSQNAPCDSDESAPGSPGTTLGRERRRTFALQEQTRASLFRSLCPEGGETPGERLPPPKLRKLDPDEFPHGGSQLVDFRSPADFAGAHVPGAMNLRLDGAFGSWARAVLDPRLPVVLLADPAVLPEAAAAVEAAGFRLEGILDRGMEAFRRRAGLLRRTPRVSVPALQKALGSAAPPLVLDLLGPRESVGPRIPGALSIPIGDLERRLDGIPRNRRLVACGSNGNTSSTAAALLERHGRGGTAMLVGGAAAWDVMAGRTFRATGSSPEPGPA